jgi:hypothetical protein
VSTVHTTASTPLKIRDIKAPPREMGKILRSSNLETCNAVTRQLLSDKKNVLQSLGCKDHHKLSIVVLPVGLSITLISGLWVFSPFAIIGALPGSPDPQRAGELGHRNRAVYLTGKVYATVSVSIISVWKLPRDFTLRSRSLVDHFQPPFQLHVYRDGVSGCPRIFGYD